MLLYLNRHLSLSFTATANAFARTRSNLKPKEPKIGQMENSKKNLWAGNDFLGFSCYKKLRTIFKK